LSRKCGLLALESSSKRSYDRRLVLENSQMTEPPGMKVLVRPLPATDLAEANRIFRVAFGTFLGLANPIEFFGDADCVRTRWAADPPAALGAYLGNELVGSNFATRWGSVAFFGPLTVRPDYWGRGIAKQLLGPTLDLMANWAVRQEGLFTFAHSPKHIALYQRFGFWPRFLTAIMSKQVSEVAGATQFSHYSEVANTQGEECLRACREMTDALYEGLDVEREIRAVEVQRLGDTVLVWDMDQLVALGVCHCGPGSEAGSDECYIKFGAARSGSSFEALLDACETLAASKKLKRLIAGANAGREKAWQRLVARGFRADFQGVAMHRHNDPGYNGSDTYIIDDWR
jgi:GNAT superfamily N-acetyltransferase